MSLDDEGPAHGLGALDLPHRQKMEILFAILLGLFLGALDQTIVGVALPTIITDLGGQSLYTWTVTIYLLASTITVPFYGKFSDIYGRKPVLMIGITIFLIGSALSGLSQNMTQLIIFRGIQGLGAGALFPISLAVIGDLFTPQERGKYQGLFGAVFGISSILGPLLGGWLTENASWHWIFYVNIPIGIVSLAFIGKLLPTVKRADASRNLDILGGFVFTIAVGAFLIGLTNKQTMDWGVFEVGGLVAIGLVLWVVFILIEWKAKEPIVPLGLWKSRTYASSIIATFLVSIGFFGAAIFLPQWFQFVYGATPTNSGLYSLALLAGVIIGSVGSGFLVSKTGKYKPIIMAGLAVMAVGLFLMSNLQADTPLPILFSWMFVTGLGIGPTLAVFTIVVQNAVPMKQLGVATSNLTFFRQVGGSVGLAALGTIFGTRLAEEVPVQISAASGIPIEIVKQFADKVGGDSGLLQVGGDLEKTIAEQAPQLAAVADKIVFGIHQALSLAIGQVFFVGVFTTLAALIVVTLFMKQIPLRKTMGPRPVGAAGAEAAVGADLLEEGIVEEDPAVV